MSLIRNTERNTVRSGGVIGTLRNCCFQPDYHEWLVGPVRNTVRYFPNSVATYVIYCKGSHKCKKLHVLELAVGQINTEHKRVKMLNTARVSKSLDYVQLAHG